MGDSGAFSRRIEHLKGVWGRALRMPKLARFFWSAIPSQVFMVWYCWPGFAAGDCWPGVAGQAHQLAVVVEGHRWGNRRIQGRRVESQLGRRPISRQLLSQPQPSMPTSIADGTQTAMPESEALFWAGGGSNGAKIEGRWLKPRSLRPVAEISGMGG